jgi:diguanylate cyclase (GGDEF)-like protein
MALLQSLYPAYAGVMAQFQCLLSVWLVLVLKETGFKIAVIANILLAVRVVIYFLISWDISALPGIFIPIVLIITLGLIRYFIRDDETHMREILKQKSELSNLNERIATFQQTQDHQNAQLMVYNQQLREKEGQLFELAYYDQLTRIPNRRKLLEQIEELIKQNAHSATPFAFAFIDLDDFKTINDRHGHHSGDFLLKEVAARMNQQRQSRDLLGRLGGDEFGMILVNPQSREALREMMENLVHKVAEPIRTNFAEFSTSVSVGVAMFPQDGKTAMEILHSADCAMYQSKKAGKNQVRFYEQYF